MNHDKKEYLEPVCIEIANYLERKQTKLTAREIATGMELVMSPIDGPEANKIQEELNQRIQDDVIPCLKKLEEKKIISSEQNSFDTEIKYRFVRKQGK